jgi:hypothetical protein
MALRSPRPVACLAAPRLAVPRPSPRCRENCPHPTPDGRLSCVLYCFRLPVALGWLWSGDTIKMRILGIVVLGAALGGCAGSPVGDAIAGPEKLAQQDDAYCESIGAAKGTPQYTNCRLTVTQQRETKHNVVRGALLSQPDNSVVIINQRR